MEIVDFKNEYVFNSRREELFTSFLDELAYMKEFLDDIKIAVFGSFITKKESPGDFDIIVIGTLNEKGRKMQSENFPKLIPCKNESIHRKGKFNTSKVNQEIEKLVMEFNNDTNNKLKNISIEEFIELNLESNR